MYPIRKTIATVAAAGTLLAGGMATPAYAAPRHDGLVNVTIDDVTVLSDINAAAVLAANACDILNISRVTALAAVVDNTGKDKTVCVAENGPVKITQN